MGSRRKLRRIYGTHPPVSRTVGGGGARHGGVRSVPGRPSRPSGEGAGGGAGAGLSGTSISEPLASDIRGMTLIGPVLRPRFHQAGRSTRRLLTPSVQRRFVYPLLLVVLTLAAFRQGFDHSFTNWDDLHYIVENPLVQGLSLERIGQAFT